MTLRELRKEKKLTQVECAKYLGIPIRTYQNYESDVNKVGSLKYSYMIQKLEEFGFIDEEHGVLSIEDIRTICSDVFKDKDIEFCYLFGSYSKGNAKETSDVDLLISTSITGLEYYELVEMLREKLKKKVDILNQEQLKDNAMLVYEILKDGIKIYGK